MPYEARFTVRQSALSKIYATKPSGRVMPKGVRDKRTQLRALLAPHTQAPVNKTVELAKSGDTTTLRLGLERIMASIRAQDEPVCIDPPGTTRTEKAQTLVDASLTGQITPSEAATLLQALATQARVIESEELALRLAALEAKQGPAGDQALRAAGRSQPRRV
jgi:hypothetical protein